MQAHALLAIAVAIGVDQIAIGSSFFHPEFAMDGGAEFAALSSQEASVAAFNSRAISARVKYAAR